MASSRAQRFLVLMAVFLLFAALQGPAEAQEKTGVIYGTVVGQADAVLADCKVSVQGTNLEAFTDLEGTYRISTVPVGEQTVVFEFLGLQTATATVTAC